MSRKEEQNNATPAAKRARAEGDAQAPMVARSKAGWPTHLRNEHVDRLLAELAPHHGAHPNAKIEWWYINAHLTEDVSFFAAFFRLAVSEHLIPKTNVPCPQATAERLHKVMWAVTDRKAKAYYTVGHCDRKSCDVLVQLMECAAASPLTGQDAFTAAALREVLEAGQMPLPDEVRDGRMAAHADQGTLQLNFDGNTFSWDAKTNAFTLKLQGQAHCQANAALRPQLSLELRVTPTKAPVLHGREGVVSMGEDDEINDMYYYLFPRCRVDGTYTCDATAHAVANGVGWVDHEFGGTIAENAAELSVARASAAADKGLEVGWQWAAVILDNDVEVSLTLLSDASSTQRFAVIREGQRPAYRVDGIAFAPVDGATWTSPATNRSFPIRWEARFVHPDDGSISTLTLQTAVQDQEFITVVAKPSFWEGHATCEGSWRGSKAVRGDAYVEVHSQASKQTDDVGAYYTLMHTFLVVPALAALETAKPASRDAAVLLVAGQVEMFAMMAAMQSKTPVPPAAKRALTVTLAAVYWLGAHPEPDAVAQTKTWADDVWRREVLPTMPNDIKRLLLRAWMLKEIADATTPKEDDGAVAQGAPAATAATTAEVTSDLPFTEASDAALSAPSPREWVDTARALFTCVCRLDKQASGSLNSMLAAQGAAFVIRTLTDNLVPTLTISVTDTSFVTQIVTRVSRQELVTRIDGSPTSWFSSGRGHLVTLACLLDGGRTLYMRTRVPPEESSHGIEHKWFRIMGAADAAPDRLVERYRYDPSGVVGADSITVERIFRVQPSPPTS